MKTMKYLSIAALAIVGAIVTSCAGDDDIIENAPQTTGEQTAEKGNVVIVKIAVNRDGAQTKALTPEGVKTFAVDDQIHLEYTKKTGPAAYAVSAALTEDDIDESGTSATFTFELEDPADGKTVYLTYPASMVDASGNIKFEEFESQDGTMDNVSSLDFSFGRATMSGSEIGSVSLENQIAVMKYTLKNAAGTEDITSTITQFTVNDGERTYTVKRSATAGPIYVALYDVENKNIEYTATDGTKTYKKFVSNKTYAGGTIYPLGLKMGALVDLSEVDRNYTAQDGDVLTNTLSGNYKISVADGATVTLDNATINGLNNISYKWAGINCEGDATIILKGTNTVKGFHQIYPGVYVVAGETLTIQGDGSLDASSNGFGAGIGSINSTGNCGNIVIESGTITATGGESAPGIGSAEESDCGTITINGGTVNAIGGQYAAGIGSANDSECGNITINGGTVNATGGQYAAGIGCGSDGTYPGQCGTITITDAVTSVTATKGGTDAPYSVGKGLNGQEGTCGTITIGGETTSGITTSPYTYPQAQP